MCDFKNSIDYQDNVEFNEPSIASFMETKIADWKFSSSNGVRQIVNRVFLNSPTGSGKTFFISKKLFKYAAINNRNILYLSNRSALKEQLEEDLHNFVSNNNLAPKDSTRDAELIFINNIVYERKLKEQISDTVIRYYYPSYNGSITLMNYQTFNQHFNFKKEEMLRYDYVVCDESHFFLEDSLFNRDTVKILKNIVERFYKSTIIFMSATLDDFKEIFTKDDKWVRYFNTGVPYEYRVFEYTNEYKEENYIPYTYKNYSEIIKKIQETPKDEKWIIFVNSKKDGKELKEKIEESVNGRLTVDFISADTKDSDTWEIIVKDSNFGVDILITTKVLDNGVNIKNSDSEDMWYENPVEHIVLPFGYEVDFKQMIGRKRCWENEKIKIYVNEPSIQNLNTFYQDILKYKKRFDRYDEIFTSSAEELKNFLLRRKYCDKTSVPAESCEIIEEFIDVLAITHHRHTLERTKLDLENLFAKYSIYEDFSEINGRLEEKDHRKIFSRKKLERLNSWYLQKVSNKYISFLSYMIHYGEKEINNLFLIDSKRRPYYNLFSKNKIEFLISYYDELRTNYKDPTYYSRKIDEWLEGKIIRPTVPLTYFGYESLDEMLLKIQGKKIGTNDKEHFYNDFMLLAKKPIFDAYNGDIEKAHTFLSQKKGKDRRKSTMNLYLEKLVDLTGNNVYYHIDLKDGGWYVNKKEWTREEIEINKTKREKRKARR